MRRVAVFTLLMLAVLPAKAAALGGINLTWDGCSLDGHVNAKTFACDANSGSDFLLYVSFAAPNTVPQFVGASAVVNVAFDDVAVPAWWQTGASQCRAGAITTSWAASDLVTSCPDPWGGHENVSVLSLQPGWRANVIRILSAAAMPTDSATSLPDDGPEYALCRIAVSRTLSTGPGACAGCATGACLYADQVVLYQPDPAPSFTLTNPLNSAYVTWNGGYAGCSTDVPVRNRSWGQIKSLYR